MTYFISDLNVYFLRHWRNFSCVIQCAQVRDLLCKFKSVFITKEIWFPHGTSKHTELRSARNFEAHGTSNRTELRKCF